MELTRLKGKRRKVNGLLIAFLGSCFLILGSQTPCKAQTFDEWFAQSKTQMKYLLEQVEALNAFQSSVLKGYQELKSDWSAIGNWKDGEYALHLGYYNSLSQVKPVVAHTADQSDIRAQQRSIIDQFNAVKGLSVLTPDELTYIGTVQRTVLADCAASVQDLQNVLQPGRLVMTDGERMKRLAGDADEVKDQYAFTSHFCIQVRLLAAQRAMESKEVQNLMPLYGN